MTSALELTNSLRDHESLSPAALHRIEEESFEELVSYLRGAPGHYATILAGMSDARLLSVSGANFRENAPRFATVEAARHFLANPVEATTLPQYWNGYLVLSTSGTSGTKSHFLLDAEERAILLALALRRLRFSGLVQPGTSPPKVAWLYSGSGPHGTYWLGECLSHHPDLEVLTNTVQPLNQLGEQITQFAPDIILGYPSRILQLAWLANQGKASIRPTGVGTSGETLTDGARAKILETWGVSPRSLYGMTEGVFGAECATQGRLHIFSDLGRIDVPNDRDLPTDSHLTNLFYRTVPVLRVSTGDTMGSLKERCACGSPFPFLSGLSGRASDILYLLDGDGETLPVSALTLHAVLDKDPAILFYRLGDPSGHLVLEVAAAVDPRTHEEISRRVHEYVSQYLNTWGIVGVTIRVVWRHPDDPGLITRGKRSRFSGRRHPPRG
jgi:phenylacetate-CoA ligase